MGTAASLLLLLMLWLRRAAAGKVAVPSLGNYQYVQEGDINIGAMLGVHKFSTDGFCSELTPPDWVIGPEAFIYAVDEINRRDDILPNITLGLVILDDCEKDTTALACAAQLVPTVDGADSCSNHTQGEHEARTDSDVDDVKKLEFYKVVGLVGPDYSRSAVMISGLLSLFEIPILGTFTTSDELSDKARYPYFVRLVSPDVYLTQAIMDIAGAFNWTYVSLVYGEGAYGENAARRIEKIAKVKGFCLAVSYRVSSDSDESNYLKIAETLAANEKARTVIVIGETHVIAGLFKAVKHIGMSNYFLWVFGDGFSFFWFEYMETDIGKMAVNAIHIDHPVGEAAGFEHYFRTVTPWTQPLRPWMASFWENKLNCSMSPSGNVGASNLTQVDCTEFETMGNFTVENWYISRYMDGVNVFAEALHKIIKDNCQHAFLNKSDLYGCVTGSRFLEAIKNVSINGFADDISFDSKGDMYGSYQIHQIQSEKDKIIDKVVGQWSRKQGIVSLDGLVWSLTENQDGENSSLLGETPKSVCSHPCGPEEYIVYSEVACCWTCSLCRSNERLVVNLSICEQCDLYTWPDEATRQVCLPIKPNFMSLNFSDPIGIALFSLAACGTVLTFCTLVDYGLKKNSKLIKATSKELSSAILFGAQLSNVLVLLFVLEPSRWVCVVREVGFHISTFLMHCPLMLKTVRIYRIFKAGQQGQQKVRLVSTRAQMLLLLGCSIIQFCLVGFMQFFMGSNAAKQVPQVTEKYVELYCQMPLLGFVIPLAIDIACVLVCAVFGYLSRKLPENYNESWYIFVSVSTTLFMWTVFLPTYYSAFYASHKAGLLGLCLLINGFTTVFLQFLPKLYAVRFVDEGRMKVHHVSNTSVAPLSTGVQVITVSSRSGI